MKVDRPALRLFFATLLHDGPVRASEVRESFATSAEYYRSVYAMSEEGTIIAKRDGRVDWWMLKPAPTPRRRK